MTERSDRLDFLIRAYPKAYRERRGDEILATLSEDGGEVVEHLPVHPSWRAWAAGPTDC